MSEGDRMTVIACDCPECERLRRANEQLLTDGITARADAVTAEREVASLRQQLVGAVVVDRAALDRAERWMLNEMHDGLSNRACVEAIVAALRRGQ